MRKPSIMFFSTLSAYPFWEGCEKSWFDFVSSEIVRDRVDCHVVLADSVVTRERGRILKDKGVEVTFYPHFLSSLVRRNLYRLGNKIGWVEPGYAYWFNLIRERRPAIVWFTIAGLQDIAGLSYAAKLCGQYSIRYVVVIQHAPEQFFCEDRELAERYTFVLENAYKVVVVSEKNRKAIERAIGTHLQNVVRTRNGLSRSFVNDATEVFEKYPVSITGPARFLSLARYSLIAKGQHILLEALTSREWREREWTLQFFGGGDSFLLKRLIHYFGLEDDRIGVSGFADLRVVIGEHDLFLMPSLSEGSPFALVEAMACGRPSVGTPVAGIPELILDGETGWIANSIEVPDFAEALENAWNARESWITLGMNAREKVMREYIQEEIFSDLLDALLDV